VIYFAITNTHLLCLQWAKIEDGETLLTKIAYKPFQHPLNHIWDNKSEFISVFSAALHQVKEDINPVGQNVILTLPDDWCRTAAVNLDSDMTDIDGWKLALWTLKQRWDMKENKSYGRYFRGNPNSIFALFLVHDFIEPIKLIFAELGIRLSWIGTESSIFFGLAPQEGCTILIPSGSTYKYFTYTLNNFGSGKARFVKDTWVTSSTVGLAPAPGLKSGKLMVAGALSDKRKLHFKDHKPLIIKSLSAFNTEGVSVPGQIPEYLQCVSNAVINGMASEVSLNFLAASGLQRYNYVAPISDIIPETPKKPAKVKKIIRPAKKKRKPSQNLIYIAVISALLFIVYFKNYFISFPKFLDADPVFPAQTIIAADTLEKEIIYDSIISDYFNKSQMIADQMSLILNSSLLQKITFISTSSNIIRIDLVGSQAMDNNFERVGEVTSYELTEIDCCGGYKHGYNIDSNLRQFQYNHKWINMEELNGLFINNSEYIVVEKLAARALRKYNQHPLKVRVKTTNRIIQTLASLKHAGDNVALEKFIYYSNPENAVPEAIFYLSLLEKSGP